MPTSLNLDPECLPRHSLTVLRKNQQVRSISVPFRGRSVRPVSSPYIASAWGRLVSPRYTVILSLGNKSARNGSLPVRSRWLVKAAAAVLAAFVVSGPNGESQVSSFGAFSGSGLREPV